MSYCLLQRAAILFGNNTAIKNTKYKLSYSELYNLSKLMDKYVINSDKSIFVIPAQCTPFYIALIFSIIRINKIYLPVSVHEKTNNINKLCADLNAKFINLTDIARNIDITKLLNKHDTNCAQEINTESLFHNKSFTEISLEHICNYYKTIPSNIILSSGSTGEPKKIVHSISSHIYSALGGQQVFYITSTDKYLLSLPLNHVGGQAIIFKCVIFGAQMVIQNEGDHSTEELLINNEITLLSLVPTQAYRLCMNENCPLNKSASIRAILLGGAPIDKQLIIMLINQNPNLKIYGSYGSTEMASQICTAEISQHICAGKALPYRQIKISHKEILVKGETLAFGYMINSNVTSNIQKITDNEGWFHTKDMGEITTYGLTIHGRIDNQFICGGENFIPEMIEKALMSLPYITKAVVVPIKDLEWGNIACAIIETNDDCFSIKNDLVKILNKIYIPKKFLPWPNNIKFSFKLNRKILQNYAEKVVNCDLKVQ